MLREERKTTLCDQGDAAEKGENHEVIERTCAKIIFVIIKKNVPELFESFPTAEQDRRFGNGRRSRWEIVSGIAVS